MMNSCSHRNWRRGLHFRWQTYSYLHTNELFGLYYAAGYTATEGKYLARLLIQSKKLMHLFTEPAAADEERKDVYPMT